MSNWWLYDHHVADVKKAEMAQKDRMANNHLMGERCGMEIYLW